MADQDAELERLTDEQRAMIARVREPLRALAHEVSSQFRTADTDELAQVASEAVCRVAPSFDASQGATFLTYVYRRALGEMVDHATREGKVQAIAAALYRGASRAGDLFEAGEPLQEDVATTRGRLVDLARSVAMAAAMGLLGPSPSVSPEAAYMIEEHRLRAHGALGPMLAALGDIERTLVWQSVVEDEPLAVVARRVGLPYDRARYLVLKSLAAMDAALRAQGIQPSSHGGDPDATQFR